MTSAFVADVDPDAGELTARFEGRDLVYGFGELDTLVPAYAATVHKSQGSEYPAVVIPVLTQHYAMLKAAGGAGRPEEGGRLRGAQRLGTPALVEAEQWLAGPTGGVESGFLTGAGAPQEHERHSGGGIGPSAGSVECPSRRTGWRDGAEATTIGPARRSGMP